MLALLVQTNTGTSNLASTVVAFSNNTVAGNSIIVTTGNTGTLGNVSGVTDTQGNVYVKDSQVSNGLLGELEIWRASGIIGGANTVTVAYTTGASCAVIAREYYGFIYTNTLDKQTTATGSSNTLSSGNTTPLTQNYELLIGFGLIALGDVFSAGGNFVNLATLNAPLTVMIAVEDLLVTSGGVQAATFGVNTTTQWAAGIVTYYLLATGTTTSTSSTSASTFSTSSTSSSISSTSSSTSSTSLSTSTSSTSSSFSSTSSSISSTSASTSSTSASTTSNSTSISSTSSSISSTSFSSTSQSSTSQSTSISSTSSSISSTSSSISSTSASTSSTSFSSTSSSLSTSTTTYPPNLNYSYQDFATITFDSASTAPTQATSPLTWSHTIGNGLNRVLIVGIPVQGSATQGTTTGVTFNGVPMTNVRTDQGANVGAGWKNEMSIWELFNPPVGTYQVSATVTIPTNPDTAGIGLSYFNVEQVNSVDSATGTNGATNGIKTLAVTPVENRAMIVSFINYVANNSVQTIASTPDTRRGVRPMSINLNGIVFATDSFTSISGSGLFTYILKTTDADTFMYAISAVSLAPSISNNNPLINPFTNPMYGTVSTDDGDYFIEYGSEYMIREYKYKNTNNTDSVTFTWKGRSTESTKISPVLIQIYNLSTAAWETLARETRVAADTDFQAQVTQSTNMSNYYDANNVITFRSYQQVI